MKNQNYTNEIKSNAVRMVLEEGLSRTEVGRRLEIPSQNISRWMKEAQKKQQGLAENGESKSLLKKKIQEQEKQIRQLQIEREILKKASAFFAKELLWGLTLSTSIARNGLSLCFVKSSGSTEVTITNIQKNNQNQADRDDETLKKRLRALFEQHKKNYGSRGLMKALREEGFKVGCYRVRKLMKNMGIFTHQRLRYKNTTDSNHDLHICENLLDRKFQPEKPNQVWTTDITYIWTAQGWLYLAIVVDLFSRKIIGWSVQDHMRTSLCKDALIMAWWRRKKPKGVMHHSDRGSQYASNEYRQLLRDYGMEQSVSRKGNCWDNSPTERYLGR
jgi:putative transposase